MCDTEVEYCSILTEDCLDFQPWTAASYTCFAGSALGQTVRTYTMDVVEIFSGSELDLSSSVSMCQQRHSFHPWQLQGWGWLRLKVHAHWISCHRDLSDWEDGTEWGKAKNQACVRFASALPAMVAIYNIYFNYTYSSLFNMFKPNLLFGMMPPTARHWTYPWDRYQPLWNGLSVLLGEASISFWRSDDRWTESAASSWDGCRQSTPRERERASDSVAAPIFRAGLKNEAHPFCWGLAGTKNPTGEFRTASFLCLPLQAPTFAVSKPWMLRYAQVRKKQQQPSSLWMEPLSRTSCSRRRYARDRPATLLMKGRGWQ